MKTKTTKRALVIAAAVLVSVLGPARVNADAGAPQDKRDPGGHAFRAGEFTIALEYDKAHAELAKADPNDLDAIVAKARLAIYEEECDLAVNLLGTGDAARTEEGHTLADIARGCARVTAATLVDKQDDVVIRWQDEDDRAIAPLLVDTAVKARDAIARDLGVDLPRPLHVTVVRDLLSLSAMTGLPYEAAQTTGTVAVAKWGRVTLLSPRASHHGYPFRDTLTHEMTHLAIAMQSRERAPLWLHEGVAKREEVRWREPGPFDDRPSVESIVAKGVELKLDLALDKLGPSIAMLPSADAAMVAFAEVTSFVRFFVESSPDGALGKLLVQLRTASSVDDALKQVSGETLPQWDVKWRAGIGKRAKEPLSPLYGLGGSPPGANDLRERARLAELLVGRKHPAEAIQELDKIPSEILVDPSLRAIRARALEDNGDTKLAEALLEDPKAWIASYGPCWAIRGRLAFLRGDPAIADPSFDEAVARDPLDVASACPPSKAGAPLCDAARKRAEPDVGQD